MDILPKYRNKQYGTKYWQKYIEFDAVRERRKYTCDIVSCKLLKKLEKMDRKVLTIRFDYDMI